MSNESSKQFIVVARPGYQVLLNIAQDCLTIDAFNPVNLNEMYNEEVLQNCASLQTHLRDGNLVEYIDQELPKDPNKQKIDALRKSTAQHIDAQFAQTARDKDHPQMQIETKTENVNDTLDKSLQEQVTNSREEIEADAQKIGKNVNDSYEKLADAPTPPDTTAEPGSAMDKSKLTLKVSMDVPQEEFIKKQQAALEQQEEANEKAEHEAHKEVDEIQSKDDPSGGQQ